MLKTKSFKLFTCFVLLFTFVLTLSSCVVDRSNVIYNVTFVANDETLSVIEIQYANLLTEEQIPADPVKTGYDFVGWFDGVNELDLTQGVRKNSIYVAKFTKTVCDVKFMIDGSIAADYDIIWGKLLDDNQIPEAPEKPEYHFLGWYVGDEKFDCDKAVKSDMEIVAKYQLKDVFAINFVVEGQTVKTTNVIDGFVIDVEEVPADPTLKAHKFIGWFNGEVEFDETAKVSDNATYTAKFELTHYITTFGEEEVLVEVGQKLSLATIENPTKENQAFVGWYCGDVKATEGMEVTENMNFEAKFVGLDSYNGTWYNEKGIYYIIENGNVVGGDFRYGKVFTLDMETGKIVYDEDGWYPSVYAFEVTNEGVKFTHDYYDASYEEYVNDVIDLVKAEKSIYQGSYRANNSGYINIIEGGVVTKYNGSDTSAGIIKEVEGKLVIVYKSAYGSEKTVEVKFDEKGNLVAEGKIFVKDSTSFKYLYYSNGEPQYYFFTIGEEEIIIAEDGSNSYYATVEGNVVAGEIITVKYNDQEIEIQVVDDSHYTLAGEEKGTYTNEDNTLVLNGFGTAIFNENEAEYVINGMGYIITDAGAYEIDATNKTFTIVEKDNAINGPYILTPNSYGTYKLTLDGYKGAKVTYTSGSGSKTEYNGKYQITETAIIISECNYSYNGSWTIEEAGKVLIKGDKLFILEGATFEDVRKNMDGAYGENGEIVVNSDASTINFMGETYKLTYNYNGAKATFTAPSEDANIPFKDELSITLKDNGNLEVTRVCYGWDEYFEGAEVIDTKVNEYAKYEVSTLDAFVGTWVGMSPYGEYTFVFNGDGTGMWQEYNITYVINNNVLTFDWAYEYAFSISGDPSTGQITVDYEYDYMDYTFVATKQQ